MQKKIPVIVGIMMLLVAWITISQKNFSTGKVKGELTSIQVEKSEPKDCIFSKFPACGGQCYQPNEVCMTVRRGAGPNDFNCECGIPASSNPCGNGTPGSCGGNCGDPDRQCRTFNDPARGSYCGCEFEPKFSTCTRTGNTCGGACDIYGSTTCQILTNEGTKKKYCGCGDSSNDPKFTCGKLGQNMCGQGTCPLGKPCVATFNLGTGKFAKCGCSNQ